MNVNEGHAWKAETEYTTLTADSYLELVEQLKTSANEGSRPVNASISFFDSYGTWCHLEQLSLTPEGKVDVVVPLDHTEKDELVPVVT